MATAAQIKALVKSYAEGDEARFYTVALQIAAHAAHHGHGDFAQQLKKLVDQARERAAAAPVQARFRPLSTPQPTGDLAGLLSISHPKVKLGDLVLDEPVRQPLERVLMEQRRRDLIRSHGLDPQRKLLLVGPPGTGKTATASALAGELDLPLCTVQLHGIITKFMGETAAKLRLVFDSMPNLRAVYFFDELDALGGERGAKNDVGEIRRVLNSFLQFLEQDESDALIVGATNHAPLLDRALFRRFDVVVDYQLPSREAARALLEARLRLVELGSISWPKLTKAAEGLCHAEIVRAAEQAVKDAILSASHQVTGEHVVRLLREKARARRGSTKER